MKSNSCYKCVDRYVGCHGKCEKYKHDTEKREELKKKIAKEKKVRTYGARYGNGVNYWSSEEERLLATYYPTMGNKVSEILPGRSPEACRGKAFSLGIRRK